MVLIAGLMLSAGLFYVFYKFSLTLQLERASKAFRQRLSDLLLKHQFNLQRQSNECRTQASTGHSPCPTGSRLDDHSCLKLDGKSRKKRRRRRHGGPQLGQEMTVPTSKLHQRTTAPRSEKNTVDTEKKENASNGFQSLSNGNNVSSEISASDSSRLDKLSLPPLTSSAALHDSKPDVWQAYGSERDILDMIFSSSASSSEYEDALEEQATDILADSDRLASGGPTQFDQSKPQSSTNSLDTPQDLDERARVTSERRRSSTFEECRRTFAAAHPLDFSMIRARVNASQFDPEYRNGNAGRTSKVGDPNRFFIFQTRSGNSTPSVEQYVDQLERIGKEVTLLYREEFEKILAQLSIFDLTYSAFKGVAKGLVGAGSLTKDKIWKLIGFGRTAVESVPEDLGALKQHFEDCTAAVVEEVAEDWLEENGGWGAMIADTDVAPEEQSEVGGQVFATDWNEFLEHVGIALQDQDSGNNPMKECRVAPEDLDALMQHLDNALHGRETGEALDYFMADINCSLHGHKKRDTEMDCMLHQVRRNLARHRRSVQLSTASSDVSKLEDLPSLAEASSEEDVTSPDVQERNNDQIDVPARITPVDNETLHSTDGRSDSNTLPNTITIKSAPRRSVSAPDLNSLVKTDRWNNSDSNEISSVNNNPDSAGVSRVWMRLTQLSLAFALGVAIGMIVIKYGI